MAKKDWNTLLSTPPPGFLLTYQAGDGANQNGVYRLEVGCIDGTAKVHSALRDLQRTWTGRVSEAARREMLDTLRAAGFPKAPPVPDQPEAGMTFRRLTLAGDNAKETLRIEEDDARNSPEYGPVFAFLDSLVYQISNGDIRGLDNTLGQAVTDVKRIA